MICFNVLSNFFLRIFHLPKRLLLMSVNMLSLRIREKFGYAKSWSWFRDCTPLCLSLAPANMWTTKINSRKIKLKLGVIRENLYPQICAIFSNMLPPLDSYYATLIYDLEWGTCQSSDDAHFLKQQQIYFTGFCSV